MELKLSNYKKFLKMTNDSVIHEVAYRAESIEKYEDQRKV